MSSPERDPKPESYARIPLSFFSEELELVKAAQARGDALGYRLDRSKTIRLLLRLTKLEAIPEAAFREVAEEVSKRRKRLKR